MCQNQGSSFLPVNVLSDHFKFEKLVHGEKISLFWSFIFSLENSSNANSFCSQCPIFRLCRIKK